MTEDLQSCTNQLCPGRDQALSVTTGFDLLVDFTDHTGTLHACSLRSPVAEKSLGYTVSHHRDDDDDDKLVVATHERFSICASGEINSILTSTVADRGVYQFD